MKKNATRYLFIYLQSQFLYVTPGTSSLSKPVVDTHQNRRCVAVKDVILSSQMTAGHRYSLSVVHHTVKSHKIRL